MDELGVTSSRAHERLQCDPIERESVIKKMVIGVHLSRAIGSVGSVCNRSAAGSPRERECGEFYWGSARLAVKKLGT